MKFLGGGFNQTLSKYVTDFLYETPMANALLQRFEKYELKIILLG